MSSVTEVIELRHVAANNISSSVHRDLHVDQSEDPSRDDCDLHAHLDGRADSQPTKQQLYPADVGNAAWKFLFGAFMVEALQWG